MSKMQFLDQYKKSLIQEKATMVDIRTTIQHLKNPKLNEIRHMLTEGDRLAADERYNEFCRVEKHLQKLARQVEELSTALSKNDHATLRSLVLITQNNLTEAKHGWDMAKQSLDEREQQLREEIGRSKQIYEQLHQEVIPKTIPSMSAAPKTATVSKHVRSNRYNESMPDQLRLIEEELSRIRAPYGGWEADKHDKFWLHFIQNKGMNRRRFVEKIAPLFPVETIQALQAHDDFCLKMQALQVKKRDFLQKLRAHKAEELQAEAQAEELKNKPFKPIPRAKKTSQEDLDKIRALKERRAMQKEDEFSNKLRIFNEQLKHQEKVRKQAKQLKLKREIQEEAKKEQKRLLELCHQQKLQELNSPQQKFKQQQLQARQKERLEKDMKSVQSNYQRIVARKKAEEERERKLQELADQLKPSVEREANSLFKATKAQEIRQQQAVLIREGKQSRDGGVTVGFDPFAVVPIGGLKKVSWM